MIHISNLRLMEIFKNITAEMNALPDGTAEIRNFKLGGLGVLDALVTEFGLKTREESMKDFADRFSPVDAPHDLLNKEHTQLVGNIMIEMFEPMQVKRIVAIGFPNPGEGMPTLITFHKPEESVTLEEIRDVIKQVLENTPEVLDL